jgi:DNA (cytosine-5)-methyltransferase 1
MKEPNEPMFTITAQDKHGVYHKGRIRKLMPVECWLLQGFTEEQFNKAQATGLKDGHLYKMAGNAVTVPVITELAKIIKRVQENAEGEEKCQITSKTD